MAWRPLPAPSPRKKRLAAYLAGLARAAGHRDRWQPLMNYCQCLLLPIERKGVEPIMARLAPDPVRGMHQFLHRIVADAPWQDSAVLDRVPQRVLPAMTKKSPLAAWIVDDTGLPKKGRHSVGVACPYCGQLGKQEICRVGHFGGRGWRGFHPHATLCIAAYGFLVAD